MIFFISDTHFYSDNIIKYCNRPYADHQEMNEDYIRKWNSVVGPDDTVYHLGDFLMHSAGNIDNILCRLNGHIVLVRGNHDTNRKLEVFAQFPKKVEIRDIAYIQHKGLFFVCSHFPMTNPEFLDMVRSDKSEVTVVHGHVHDKTPFFTPETHTFNVSADVIDGTPVPITTLYSLVKEHFKEMHVWKGGN